MAATVFALVVAGFILGGVLEASGAKALPGVSGLKHLPKPARIVIEIVIGVPLAFGVALYFVAEWVDFLWMVSWPLRKLVGLFRRT